MITLDEELGAERKESNCSDTPSVTILQTILSKGKKGRERGEREEGKRSKRVKK